MDTVRRAIRYGYAEYSVLENAYCLWMKQLATSSVGLNKSVLMAWGPEEGRVTGPVFGLFAFAQPLSLEEAKTAVSLGVPSACVQNASYCASSDGVVSWVRGNVCSRGGHGRDITNRLGAGAGNVSKSTAGSR